MSDTGVRHLHNILIKLGTSVIKINDKTNVWAPGMHVSTSMINHLILLGGGGGQLAHIHLGDDLTMHNI